MRHLAAVALLAALAACSGEESNNEAGGGVAMLNTTPDPEGETGEDVSSSAPTPVAASGYNTADIPPCLSIYEGATRVRTERTQNQYGPRYSLSYAVDAPIQDVVAFYQRTVRENGCRLDHIQTRNGIEFFTLWSDTSLKNERSASLEIGSANNGAGPTGVGSSGHWITP